MHRPQFFTWTTHTAENTTLLEATRLQKLYTHMCNIVTELVTEFYLYSIVYIYSINSRLDVAHSVHHHFHTMQTLSWCQTSGKSREVFTVIELTHIHSISRGFLRGLFEYSDFFRDHTLQPQHIGDVRRKFIYLWTQIGT